MTAHCRMPLLYGSITHGRFLAILFFFCVTLAGLSSLISILELCVHVLEDFGSSHYSIIDNNNLLCVA